MDVRTGLRRWSRSGAVRGFIPLSIVGLDIEVTIRARGHMPVPHDELICKTISNEGWYFGDGLDQIPDICYCTHCRREVDQPEGKDPKYIKVGSSTPAVEATYEILTKVSPDFVNIHNGFGLDLKSIPRYRHTQYIRVPSHVRGEEAGKHGGRQVLEKNIQWCVVHGLDVRHGPVSKERLDHHVVGGSGS